MILRARALAAAVLVTIATVGCRPEDGPPVASEVLREGVDMVMIPMDTYLTREGIRRALLHTDTAEFVAEGEIQMRGVELTFFDVDGREASVITAESGTFYENTEDMEASGSIVVLDRREDRRLETEELRYVAAEDRLYGDRRFTLWEDGGRTELRGEAFESDPGLDSVRVRRPSGQSERPPTPPTAGATADTAAAAPPPAATDTAGRPVASDTAVAGAPPDTIGTDDAGDPTAAETSADSATRDTTAAGEPIAVVRRGSGGGQAP